MDKETIRCWFEYEIEVAKKRMKQKYNPIFNGVKVGHGKQIELNKAHIQFCKNAIMALCSLKDEVPKQTNGDRIRSMTNEELAEWIHNIAQFHDDESEPCLSIYDIDTSEEIELYDSYGDILYFLNKERDTN